MTRAAPTLRARALSYLATREHSRLELARKLARHDDDNVAIEALLDSLESQGLLSIDRYVASVLHRRAPRLGGARLRQELRAKGVPDEVVRDSLQPLADTEEARAREVWSRRFGTAAIDARERARQARFLLARGFPGEVVRRVLRDSGADVTGPDDDASCSSSHEQPGDD